MFYGMAALSIFFFFKLSQIYSKTGEIEFIQVKL